ncbi:MAG: molybdopterin biosynthesis protein MoeB [Bacillales bacterium]|nr:molybdopterin biosynthesis protein MoeB [Bacillales bacterium]
MDDLLNRYSRQILFNPIGKLGQEKLINSRVVVVGVGALGSVVVNHLVRAGVGFIRIIDRDVVDLSNLQRQTLFNEDDVVNNLPKVIAAKKTLEKINSKVVIDSIIGDLNPDNAEELLTGFDVIIDGTDNLITRFLINDVAVKNRIPWVHGGAVSSRGMFAVIIPGVTPCYRCLFPEVPFAASDTCDTVGVLSATTATNKNLEQLDIWSNEYMQMDISNGKIPECKTCGKHIYEFLDKSSDKQLAYTSLCGRDTVQISSRSNTLIELEKLAQRLKNSGDVLANPYLVQFSPNEQIKIVLFNDGRALIHGTNDTNEAKNYYAKYIGT